jgi:SAM-dependent methyltransferase
LDELSTYNKERWEELAQAGTIYARPFLDLTADDARKIVDELHLFGDCTGKDVLCLGGGGGQQAIAFALLGAHVTVFDIADTQLVRDRQAAQHYGVSLTTVQGDMRDLGHFADRSFDIVWQPYSINFVPDVRPVFAEVARVIRPGGFYQVDCHNPFTQLVDETTWNGKGYLLSHLYRPGEEIVPEEFFSEPDWVFEDEQGIQRRVKSPRSWRHGLGTMLNELIHAGFMLIHFAEVTAEFAEPGAPVEPDPEPGSWAHYMAVVAPYFRFWTIYRPKG